MSSSMCVVCENPMPRERLTLGALTCVEIYARIRKSRFNSKTRTDSLPVPEVIQPCAFCGKPIPLPRLRSHADTCSPSCRRKLDNSRRADTSKTYPLANSTGVSGAISELRVSVDLLSRGYEVFRALSPACSCDLVVLANRQLYCIEVRTGGISANGGLHYGQNKIRADIMAVVTREEIFYVPALPVMLTQTIV